MDFSIWKNIEFAYPVFFGLLVLIPLMIYWYVAKQQRKQPAMEMSSLQGLKGLPVSWKVRLRPVLLALRLLAFTALVVALARPQTNNTSESIDSEGIDIVLAIDISGSMLAEDLQPNRLDAAKNVAMDFVDRRISDRIGLVIFSGESFTQCPITTDHGVLKNQIMLVKSGMLQDGTAIGMGLATSVDRLRSSKAKSKVIILLTDGVNNTGLIDPLTALEISKAFKIRVYTIGVGTIGKAPFPMTMPDGSIQMQMQDVQLDEPLMKKVSTETGGKYFRATNNKDLQNIYAEIDKLEKTKVEITSYKRYAEHFFPVCHTGPGLHTIGSSAAIYGFQKLTIIISLSIKKRLVSQRQAFFLTAVFLPTFTPINQKENLQATIYRSTGSWYTAKTTTGEIFQARIKGLLKRDGDITSTNPIAVGDIVEIVVEDGDANAKNAMITEIGERRNYIVRSSPHRKNQKHIVAANLDQAMLICTLKEPRTSNGFMDRFLVTAAAYHIPVTLVFNKKDIYKEKEIDRFAELAAVYEDIGYTVALVSATTGEGVDELTASMENKTTLMSGHSGVGKSSLINRLLPGLDLRTTAVSGWSGKGLHTTTYAEMQDLPNGGKLIDTPGVREFGVIDIPKTELSHYFLEMQAYLNDCQFNNCLHINEPGCAVKAAVEAGDINMERYISYATILETIEEKSY